MALSVAIAVGAPGSSAVAERVGNYVATVTNTGASAVTLQSLSVNCNGGDARISQPQYLTPNVPVGVGNPVINGGSSLAVSFQAVFDSPYFAGPSPQNPGGASASNAAANPDALFVLQAIGNTSDGSVFSGTILVPVLSTIAPFPVPEGGSLIFTQGSNLITLIMLGAI